MPSWTSKDPDAVLDYSYTIPLDEGDSVNTYLLEKLEGTVVIDSGADDALAASPSIDADGNRGQLVSPVWLSGGTAGETNVFRISWVTSASPPREDERIITLPVVAAAALVLTGYAKPSAVHLIDRYPAFADVAVTMIEYWLTDAERYVDESWSEGDYAAAIMAMAAHNMEIAGLGTTAATLSSVPAGITRMKSGSFELAFTESAANNRANGAYASTRYGAEYEALLRRNRGGPRVMATGARPDYYPGWP